MGAIDTSPVPARPAQTKPPYKPVIPAPEPYVIPRNGKAPDFTWEFRQPDGGLVFVVTRYNGEGEEKKKFIPWTFDGAKWQPKGIPTAARPLYNAPLLAASPAANVLIVEGEKTADAARAYVPDGWVVTTWHGGAQAVKRSDWAVLQGHVCVMWRDNDLPGVQAQVAIEGTLSDLGIAYDAVTIPRWLSDGWDLADPLPEPWSPEKVRAQIVARANAATVKLREMPAPEEGVPHAAVNYLVDDQVGDNRGEREYECLGHDDSDLFYFISRRTKGIVEANRRLMLSGEIAKLLVPDLAYWSRQYGTKEGIPWKSIGVDLLDQCMRKGHYSPERLRGRGVWMDDGRVIAHLGDRIVVDGVVTDAASIDSHYVYPQRARFAGGVGSVAPLTDEIGRQFRAACRIIKWEKPVYGDLLAGWIAMAPICGALPWRPHIWVSAPIGSGKTFVLEQIVTWAISPMLLFAKGATTAPGIKVELRADALPVIFDESEADDQLAQTRMVGVLQFARNSSQEGEAKEYKSSAHHEGVSFAVRSSVCLCSVRVALEHGADMRRFSVLTMKKGESDTEEERAANEEHFAGLKAALAALPSDFSQRLISRQIRNLKNIRATVEVFSEQIARSAGDRALGQQLGALISGCWSLVRQDVPTPEAAAEYLRKFNWGEFNEAKDSREDVDIFRFLSSRMIRFAGTNGKPLDRSLGEVCGVAADVLQDADYLPGQAGRIMSRMGIAFMRRDGALGFALGMKHDQLDELLAKSQYAKGWRRIMARHPQAVKGEGDMTFGALRSSYVWVPVGVIVGGEDEPTDAEPSP